MRQNLAAKHVCEAAAVSAQLQDFPHLQTDHVSSQSGLNNGIVNVDQGQGAHAAIRHGIRASGVERKSISSYVLL